MRTIFLLLPVLLPTDWAWTIPPEAPSEPSSRPFHQTLNESRFVRIPIVGEIGQDVDVEVVTAQLAVAEQRGAYVILTIDSPGGGMINTRALVQALRNHNQLKIVALVKRADGEAAAIPTECDVVLRYGDAAPADGGRPTSARTIGDIRQILGVTSWEEIVIPPAPERKRVVIDMQGSPDAESPTVPQTPVVQPKPDIEEKARPQAPAAPVNDFGMDPLQIEVGSQRNDQTYDVFITVTNFESYEVRISDISFDGDRWFSVERDVRPASKLSITHSWHKPPLVVYVKTDKFGTIRSQAGGTPAVRDRTPWRRQ